MLNFWSAVQLYKLSILDFSFIPFRVGRVFGHKSFLKVDAECICQFSSVAMIRIVAGSDDPMNQTVSANGKIRQS